MKTKPLLSDYLIMFSDYPDVMSTKMLCEILNHVSRKLGYRLMSSGAIRSIKIGREYKTTKLWVLEYLTGEVFSVSDYYKYMFINYPDMVGAKLVETMLDNISSRLVYNLIQTGKIKSRRIGREYKVAKLWIFEYLTNEILTNEVQNIQEMNNSDNNQ